MKTPSSEPNSVLSAPGEFIWPVIAAGVSGGFVQPLLDYGPAPFPVEDEALVIDLVAVLDRVLSTLAAMGLA